MNVVYLADWLHVECDVVELLGMTHERVDQFPLTAADADAIVQADHEHWCFRSEFLQSLGALFEAFIEIREHHRLGKHFQLHHHSPFDRQPSSCLDSTASSLRFT